MNINDLMSTNEVKVNMHDYSLRISARSGKGKTPLYAYFCEAWRKESGNENIAYLIPLENRYNHIKGLKTLRPKLNKNDSNDDTLKDICETWEDVVDIVNMLVKAKKEDRNFPIKRVCFDTTTKIYELAQRKAIQEYFNEFGEMKTFNQIYGSYGGGNTKAIELTKDQIVMPLRKHGFIVDTLSQCKIKTQKHPITMEEYHIYSVDSGESYDEKAFWHDLDISMYITDDGKVEKTGDKVLRFIDDEYYKGTKSPFIVPVPTMSADDFETTVKTYMDMFKNEMCKSRGVEVEKYEELAKTDEVNDSIKLDKVIKVEEVANNEDKFESDKKGLIAYIDENIQTLSKQQVDWISSIGDYKVSIMEVNEDTYSQIGKFLGYIKV